MFYTGPASAVACPALLKAAFASPPIPRSARDAADPLNLNHYSGVRTLNQNQFAIHCAPGVFLSVSCPIAAACYMFVELHSGGTDKGSCLPARTVNSLLGSSAMPDGEKTSICFPAEGLLFVCNNSSLLLFYCCGLLMFRCGCRSHNLDSRHLP